jgi:hypothetical protein
MPIQLHLQPNPGQDCKQKIVLGHRPTIPSDIRFRSLPRSRHLLLQRRRIVVKLRGDLCTAQRTEGNIPPLARSRLRGVSDGAIEREFNARCNGVIPASRPLC